MNGDSRGITQGIFAPYPLKERILAEYDAWILGKKSKQFKFFVGKKLRLKEPFVF